MARRIERGEHRVLQSIADPRLQLEDAREQLVGGKEGGRVEVDRKVLGTIEAKLSAWLRRVERAEQALEGARARGADMGAEALLKLVADMRAKGVHRRRVSGVFLTREDLERAADTCCEAMAAIGAVE